MQSAHSQGAIKTSSGEGLRERESESKKKNSGGPDGPAPIRTNDAHQRGTIGGRDLAAASSTSTVGLDTTEAGLSGCPAACKAAGELAVLPWADSEANCSKSTSLHPKYQHFNSSRSACRSCSEFTSRYCWQSSNRFAGDIRKEGFTRGPVSLWLRCPPGPRLRLADLELGLAPRKGCGACTPVG